MKPCRQLSREGLGAFVNCSITKGISQRNFRENVISGLESQGKQLKTVLIVYDTQMFSG